MLLAGGEGEDKAPASLGIQGLADVFGSTVVTYRTKEELVELLRESRDDLFPSRVERLDLADRISREHSFDARARVLIDAVADA
jgi:hypothetical protein